MAGAVVFRGDPAAMDVLMVSRVLGVGGDFLWRRSGRMSTWRRVPPVRAVRMPCWGSGSEHRSRLPRPVTVLLGWRGGGRRRRPRRSPRLATALTTSAWLPAGEAAGRAVGTGDELVIGRAVGLAETVPILIVRHGKAMARSDWSGRDRARPLTARGRRQAAALMPLLTAYGVTRLASSTSTRCLKTLVPFGTRAQLEIEGWATLSEEQAELSLKAVDKLMRRLIEQTLESGQPLAVCGHRPVLPTMLAALGIPARQLTPGACVVAHLDPDGHRLGFEQHQQRL